MIVYCSSGRNKNPPALAVGSVKSVKEASERWNISERWIQKLCEEGQIEGVQIGITMTEKADGTVRVSVRTTREMDASAICKRVGGGGHVRAAGASFTCGMDEAKAEMLRVAKEQFHAAD